MILDATQDIKYPPLAATLSIQTVRLILLSTNLLVQQHNP